MPTPTAWLADTVVVFHLLWIVFLIFGAALGWRYAWIKWTHLAALAFSITLQTFGWICPLTHLEVWLRRQADPDGAYAGSFIGHYAERLVYAPIPPPWVLGATAVVVAVSLWVYFGRASRRG